jgi:putative ABC transport system permease protein
MLKNYFKIAIAVLKRRKFFTFISLFGISFTLSILILVSAFLENFLNGNYPARKSERILYINHLKLTDEEKGYQSTSSASFHYLNKYVSTLKTPEKVGISSVYKATNSYVRNKKLVLNIKYTNADYWNVLDYKFLEGRPLSEQDVQTAQQVAVISEDTRRKYFGNNNNVVGKYIETDNVRYRICGVVESIPITSPFTYGDVYLPYTLPTSRYRENKIQGNFTAIILAKSKADLPAIQKEYLQVVSKIPLKGQEYNKIVTAADTYAASLTRSVIGDENSTGLVIVMLVINLLGILFLLLPTLNLMNINISRIMERSSEIGVRKAFGASSSALVYQFIVENLILTGIGCVIGLILSAIFLAAFNSSGIIENISLNINFSVVLYALAGSLVFGLLSGVYPAWRMSKMHVVNSLKV